MTPIVGYERTAEDVSWDELSSGNKYRPSDDNGGTFELISTSADGFNTFEDHI